MSWPFNLAKTISTLSMTLSFVLLATAVVSRLVPFKYVLLLGVVLALPNALLFRTFFIKKSPQKTKTVMLVLASLMIVFNVLALLGFSWGISLINQVTSDSSIVKKDIVTSKPFNLYISGIDTYGDIGTVSRSDVNIVATINPQTRRILLTTIPRDSYVRIAGGGNNQYDKLTHSGNYGITSSIQTIAQLLKINMDTYVRINFTSFIKIVDEINGIEVYNPIEFQTDSKQVFKKGRIHLNGKDALTFSRERHNLAGGDNDRGVNQERVITGIFDKMTTPSILNNYLGVLEVLSNSMQTNISQASIRDLVNQLIDDSGYWKIDSQSISGKGETGQLPSYAMPNSQLYMYVLDDQSLSQAQSRIIATQNTGKK